MRKRSKFNLSNYHNLTGLMGRVIPVNCTEVLPGDSIQQSTSVFMRLAPLAAPVMHPLHMLVMHYYVPTRILWEDFESFITGGDTGEDVSVPPTVNVKPEAGTLSDYFGLPLGNTLSVSALPFRAYNMIWNEYFRDQDLQAAKPISLASGVDTTTPTNLLKPCWSKDYFTTARSNPQKGPGVTIPIDLSAGQDPVLTATTTLSGKPALTGLLTAASVSPVQTARGYMGYGMSADGSGNHIDVSSGSLAANTSVTYNAGTLGTGAISVDDVREAFALQRFAEHRSLFGSRYEDYLRYIGVRPQDSRLQMPEYLGGGSQVIQFSEVLQTSPTAADAAVGVGNLFGHGIGAMRSNRYRRFIPEHGYIISLLVVRPIPVYTQGVERMWSRKTREDYWQVETQHIGQQEVFNKEVFANGSADDDKVFGYQNRYDEYRRGVNICCGEFRSTLDYWNMARIFASRPALNSDFVECNPTDRIFQLAEQNSDQIYCMVKNNIVARRLVDRNGNPI